MSEKLSPREQEVARLVAIGRTARQIGEALGISAFTVRNHKTSIYRKLDVTNAILMVRKMASPFRADVLRGERTPFEGDWSNLDLMGQEPFSEETSE